MTEDRTASTPCCIAIFGRRPQLSVRTSILLTKQRLPNASDGPDEAADGTTSVLGRGQVDAHMGVTYR
jgi:hypothetical protein